MSIGGMNIPFVVYTFIGMNLQVEVFNFLDNRSSNVYLK